MRKRTLSSIALALLLVMNGFSQSNLMQQTFPLTETAPANADGMSMGYQIKNAKEKEVGDKGEFSRYSIQFYISNTSAEAKIFLYNQGWQVGNDVSPYIVQFDCLNATGARLTSKFVQLQMAPCNVLGVADEKDANNKLVRNKKFVQVGYWIKPGETIRASAIVIVPLNEMPNIRATLYPSMNAQMIGNASVINQPAIVSAPVSNNYNSNFSPNVFLRIRNASKNTYVNTERGMAEANFIKQDAWSSHWTLMPVAGRNAYFIKNRWKGNFLSTDNVQLVSDNYNNNDAWWTVEPVPNSNAVRLRNVGNGTYLTIGLLLESSNASAGDQNSYWILEQ